MADYYSPTVIQPAIPNADMTSLERLILSEIFTADEGVKTNYFYAEDSSRSWISVSRADMIQALDTCPDEGCRLKKHMASVLAEADPKDKDIDIDATAFEWAYIFQDIVARSPTLDYITVVSAFTCSKMRPDGFGGMAMLISGELILCKSTEDILAEFFAQVETVKSAHVQSSV